MPVATHTPSASFRHLVAGYLLDAEGKSVRLTDIVSTTRSPVVADVQNLLLAKARREGLALGAGSLVGGDQIIPLPPMPRPASSDDRATRAWDVSAYIVVHDVKFAGYGKSRFQWPDQPTGETLQAMLMVIVADTLVPIFLEPADNMRAELHNVTVASSQ